MNNRRTLRKLSELRGSLVILVPGALGAFIVLRTWWTFWGRDRLASTLVGTIGIALLVGVMELVLRQLRIERLERELNSLPARPSESTIEGASPLMAAILRARLEQVPPPSLGESLAPFLTGLLVMLGLLGTLLGLFQTVQGAGHALTQSADLDALRHSLSSPIDGLTRSFGCSAAGISASAMLGLAAALVRRREGRVLRVIAAYAGGPLRNLSPIRRQARALEQLAGPGSALEGVGTQLGELSNQLVTLQQTALKAQQRAFSDLL
ncbi:MAG: hypothetical protein ABW321_23135, partial [Polyangiales bacterium]